MSSTTNATIPSTLRDERSADALIPYIETAGVGILRYGLVLLLIMWGGAKFTAFEAEAIKPLVENSPFVGWMYGVFGLRGAAALFGVFEVLTAVLIAARRWLPRVSGYASLVATSMFLVTLSFLVTTPNVFAPTSPWGGFLMKDIILLGAALYTSAEALRAAAGRVE
jgi:uncharacterized membrane protein YkgB